VSWWCKQTNQSSIQVTVRNKEQ